MNRSFTACLIATSIAAATPSLFTKSPLAERIDISSASISETSSAQMSRREVKPGKSKKYKKKMSKQMKKRKRH